MVRTNSRRGFILGAVISALLGFASAQEPTVHEVKMLNINPDNPRERMVFVPKVLKIQPGDSVKFISTDFGHNTQTSDGMIPAGTEGWKSKAGEDFTVTLTEPGLYGYNCQPHVAAGMVGLIIVEGEGMLQNLEEAKAVRQVGLARRVWDDIWTEVESMDHTNL
ncbi:MAG: pseudoazurin [Pseudomonadota bacterium]